MKNDSFSYSLNFFFYLAIILIGYFLFAYNGKFIIDDFAIVNSDKTLNLLKFYKNLEPAFSNRPLSIFYYFIISKLPNNYALYFIISLSQHILCIFLIYKLFDFLFYSQEIKKIFFVLVVFPFFSFTTLYSPAMQSVGNYSLAIFLFALILLKKFIVEKKKYLYVLCIVLIFLAFLTYESFFPLIILFLFFPLIYKQNYKILFINFLCILIILLIIFFFQKYLAFRPEGEDLSRIRNLNIFSIIKLCFVNLSLLINFFFLENFYDAFLNIENLVNKNLYFTLAKIIFFNFIFIYLIFKLRRRPLNSIKLFKVFFIIISIIFLTILMHSVANTVVDFRDYNNRGMLAMSFAPSIFLLFLYNSTIKNNYIIFFKFFFIAFYFSIIVNFFSFQQYEHAQLEKSKNIYLTVKEKNLIDNNTFLFIKIESQNYIENKYSYSSSNYFNIFIFEDHDYLKNIFKNNLIYKNYHPVEINDFTVVFNKKYPFCKYFLINDGDLKRYSNFIILNIVDKTYARVNLTQLKKELYIEKNKSCINEYEILLKNIFYKNSKTYLDEKNIPLLIKNLYIYNFLKLLLI